LNHNIWQTRNCDSNRLKTYKIPETKKRTQNISGEWHCIASEPLSRFPAIQSGPQALSEFKEVATTSPEVANHHLSSAGHSNVDPFGKSKILKICTEIFVLGLSICEPTIPKTIIIVQIYKKLHGNHRSDNLAKESVKMIDAQSDVYSGKYLIPSLIKPNTEAGRPRADPPPIRKCCST
jgi:hypothetical protein